MNEFSPLDEREYKFYQGINYDVIFYQIDLLRIYNILVLVNSINLANKIKRLIYFKDKLNNTKTYFNRVLPKGEIEKFLMSPKKYVEYKYIVKEFDEAVNEFYK